jgi:hypothetical protein
MMMGSRRGHRSRTSDAILNEAPKQMIGGTTKVKGSGSVPNDPVPHPSHYTSSPAYCAACGHTIEAIDVTRWMGFNLGNVVKYVWRADLKGKAIEDLKKAAFYLRDEIEKREKGLG